MTTKAAGRKPRRGRPATRHSDVDQTIARVIAEKGDATLGTIVDEVRGAFPISRATIARRLDRMLRFSQVVRLRHGHYTVGGVSTRSPPTVLRLRSNSLSEVVSPDGSTSAELTKEFLVLSGRCDRLTFQLDPMARLLAKDVRVSSSRNLRVTLRNERGRTTIVTQFTPPIPAGPWSSHRVSVSFHLGAGYYPMKRSEPGPRSRPGSTPPSNLHAIGVLTKPDLGVLYEVSDDTVLDMQVHFPSGFPRGPVEPRITFLQSNQVLEDDARKLLDLSRKSKGRLGLTARDDLVTLRVKGPTIDCSYGFSWTPPLASSYSRWIRRHL